MSLFDMLEEVKSESQNLRHSFCEKDIEFRMAYASALSMAAHAEGSLDPDKSTKLKGIFASLGLKDQSEKFLELGAKPDKAVLMASLEQLNESIVKAHFIVDLEIVNTADGQVSEAEKKALEQFIAIFKISPTEEKLIAQIKSISKDLQDKNKWIQETMSSSDDVKQIAQIIAYHLGTDFEPILADYENNLGVSRGFWILGQKQERAQRIAKVTTIADEVTKKIQELCGGFNLNNKTHDSSKNFLGISHENMEDDDEDGIDVCCPNCDHDYKEFSAGETICPECEWKFEIDEDGDVVAGEPIDVRCPSCNHDYKEKSEGKTFCPECKWDFVIDEDGDVTSGAPIDVCCPNCDHDYIETAEGNTLCPECKWKFEIDEDGDVVAGAPIDVCCPNCDHDYKEKSEGKTLCPECKWKFEIDEDGDVTSGAPIEVSCPNCEHDYKEKSEGKTICPECKCKFEIDEDGYVVED